MATTYRVERSDDGLIGWSIVSSGLSGLSTVLSSQPVNSTKFYRIIRLDNGYEVASSNTLKVVILTVPTLSASGGAGADRITLTWDNVSATKYFVYRYNPNNATYSKIGITVVPSFFDMAVSQNITYWYYVTAVSTENNETLPSNSAYGTILNGGVFSMGLSRATQYQGIQIGIETTPGTQVPATRRLVNVELMQTPQIPVKTTSYAGMKGVGGTQKGQRYTDAKFNGLLDYSLLPYLATLGWGPAVVVTANNASTWRWNPSAVDPITPSSATIEQGSTKGAEKFGYATLSDISIKWSREDASIEGSIFGQAQTRTATLTTNLKLVVTTGAAISGTSLTVAVTKADGSAATGTVPAGTYVLDAPFVNPFGVASQVSFTSTGAATITAGSATLTVSALAAAVPVGAVAYSVREVISTPVDPEEASVWVSTDGVNFTQLTMVLDGAVNFSGLYKPSFHVNDSNTSFDCIVESQPKITASITVEEGSEADTFMGYLDGGQKVWLGVQFVGSTINASPLVKHKIRLNIPMYITKPDPADKNDVYGNTFTFELAHDQAFGMFDLQVVNRFATL